jgi:hypothetical protein
LNEITEKSNLKQASRVSDYRVKMTETDKTQTRWSTKSVNKLIDAQRKAYKIDLIDYQVWDKYADM